MTPPKSLFPALLLMLAAATPTSAQTQPTPPEKRTRIQGGVGMLAGAPLGEFGNNVVDGAAGLSGHLDVGLGDSVVSVGGEAAYLWYGEESREVPLSPTIPDVLVTVNTDNAMVLLHGRLRAQPRRGRWRPYVDGLFGFNYIFTTTSLEGTGSSPALESTNLDDFVLSVGGGVGVMFGFGSSPRSLRLDVGVRYLYGGEADYLTEGAIRREGGQAFLDISRSRTDMVLVYIGIAGGR